MTIRTTICLSCRHFRPGVPGIVCDAFPDGIPREIFFGDREHFTPYPGDHDIQFAPKPTCPPEWVARYEKTSAAREFVESVHG